MQFQLTLILDLFWQSSDINFFGIFHSGKNQFSSSRPFHSCVPGWQALIWSGAECDLVVIETSM